MKKILKMNLINLVRNKAFPWFCMDDIYVKGYLYGVNGELFDGEDLIRYFKNIYTQNELNAQIAKANGTFSVVIKLKDSILLGVDRFRTFPLFYRIKDETIEISDEVAEMIKTPGKKEMDATSKCFFSCCGYTLGRNSLLKDIYQLQAGETLLYSSKGIERRFYHCQVATVQEKSYQQAKQELHQIIETITSRMAQYLRGKQVYLPLSGGLDSRLIAYMLKKANVQNVTCFTFGLDKGNPEKSRAQIVAERLGFDWKFINYAHIDKSNFRDNKRFLEFYKYEANYVSKFAFMQYFSAEYLVDVLHAAPGSVVIPGHGGDFFSGSHLRPYMKSYTSINTIATDLEYIHFDLVKKSRTDRNLIRKQIKEMLIESPTLFTNVENWDLKERQAKYIINSCKLWEFYNLQFFMPLCDNAFMDFFVNLPFEYRLYQKLYKEVVHELFAEDQISFPQDFTRFEETLVQKIKVLVKRNFPFIRKKRDLFQDDYFDFKNSSQLIVKELIHANRFSKIQSMNGIFTEWYLLQLENELRNLN